MKRRTTLGITLALVAAIAAAALLFTRNLWMPPARRSGATHTVHRASLGRDHREASAGQISVIIPEVNARTVDFMEQHRGFFRFGEFNKALTGRQTDRTALGRNRRREGASGTAYPGPW